MHWISETMDAFPSSETPDLQAAPRGSDTTLSHSRCGHHSGRGCLDDPAARDAEEEEAQEEPAPGAVSAWFHIGGRPFPPVRLETKKRTSPSVPLGLPGLRVLFRERTASWIV